MKKIFTIFGLVMMGASAVNAQIINFPDANFKAAIIKAYPAVDANKDGQISETEALTLTSIRNLSNYPNIYDATGIEYFTNLTELNLGDLINLNKIDVSKNTKVTTLNLRNNKLTGVLDVSALDKMTNIELNKNLLTGIIFPQNSKLKIVYINENALTTIDLSELKDLQRLFLVTNKLTSLDVSQNPNLERIHINDNQLTTLDLSGLTKLNWFSAESNKLTAITFSNNPLLKTILTKNNQLTSFDFMDGFDNNITLINVESNPNFNLIKKDCNDIIVNVPNTTVETNCSLAVDNQAANNIKIYPTLAKDFITVEGDVKNISFQIFNLSGQLLQSGILNTSKIDVSKLSKATYILVLKTDEKLIKQSFIKQ
ncbi:T9SS type A sorting domain-containing protein [Soonwooa sp.]|uniref:leucine-rich repeat domain-containing protein n=1 Tax=Soonwooa sp. TaxID=1938592 RepID=UPI002608D479|nr:T9SS type A sorting domain-containing protein [Soonwooa sp.]